jgi:hypothetical protein
VQANVVIFLHDVGRPVEKEIVQQYFSNNTINLGIVRGPAGDLAAFLIQPL